MKRLKRLAHALGVSVTEFAGMTASEPSYPPLSTREIQTLPEGARVIVTWAEGNDGPHEYRVHWRRGEPYAQTDEDHRQGHVDLEKWLTYYVGPRRPFTRVGRSPLGVPNDSGINSALVTYRGARDHQESRAARDSPWIMFSVSGRRDSES